MKIDEALKSSTWPVAASLNIFTMMSVVITRGHNLKKKKKINTSKEKKKNQHKYNLH